MSFVLGERFVARSSPVHRADGRLKIGFTFLYVLVLSMTPDARWWALAALATPVIALVGLSRLPVRLILGRSLLALPFVLAAVPVVFTRPGDPVFAVPAVGWTATRTGLEALATILCKSWVSVVLAAVLTASTTPIELVRSLRGLRVPALLAAVVFFTYRYLFAVGEEAQQLMRGRDSRSAAIPGYRSGGSVGWRARILGAMVGTLFLRSFERSERVFAAMQARGYDGEPRFLDAPRLSMGSVLVAAVVIAYGVGVQAYVRLG